MNDRGEGTGDERKLVEERNIRACHIKAQFLFYLICHCSSLSLERKRKIDLWKE